MICHSWFGLSLVLQFMKIDYPWLILPAHLWTHAMVYDDDDDDSWTVHNKPMHSICTDVLPSLTTCYKKLQRVLCRILEEKNQLSANAASIKKPWWQIRVCFFSFLAHSCGRSSWLTETECELRNRKRERGVRVFEGELTSSWFLCWGREGLIVPRRKHGELCQVFFFFSHLGVSAWYLLPLPTAHFDLTAINIWCSNCTLKHESPTGPVVQCGTESFYSIPKMCFLPIICKYSACIFVKNAQSGATEQPKPLTLDTSWMNEVTWVQSALF